MQAISSRPFSSWRVGLPMPDGRNNALVMVSPQSAPDGSPWVVVEDYTDNPQPSRSGYYWVVDCDPNSRSYGDAIEVQEESGHHGIRVLHAYLRQNPHLKLEMEG